MAELLFLYGNTGRYCCRKIPNHSQCDSVLVQCLSVMTCIFLYCYYIPVSLDASSFIVTMYQQHRISITGSPGCFLIYCYYVPMSLDASCILTTVYLYHRMFHHLLLLYTSVSICILIYCYYIPISLDASSLSLLLLYTCVMDTSSFIATIFQCHWMLHNLLLLCSRVTGCLLYYYHCIPLPLDVSSFIATIYQCQWMLPHCLVPYAVSVFLPCTHVIGCFFVCCYIQCTCVTGCFLIYCYHVTLDVAIIYSYYIPGSVDVSSFKVTTVEP